MFIRYNEAIDFYEYDTSAGQTGAGPWLVLPLDYVRLTNKPVATSYEVGNWTPSLAVDTGGSTTYSEQTGRYTKIGDLVYCSFSLTISTASWNISQTLKLVGFPFISLTALAASGTLSYYTQSRAVYSLDIYMPNGLSSAIFHCHNSFSGSIDIALLAGDIPANGRFIGSVVYKAG